MELIIWIVVIIAFVVITLVVKGLKVILLNPLRIPNIELSKTQDIDKALKPLYVEGHQQLKDLGFKGHCVYKAQSIYQNIKPSNWVVQYWHPEHRCFAALTLGHSPTVKTPYKIDFTAYQNDTEYTGTHKFSNAIFKEYTKFKVKDFNHSSLSDRLNAYLRDLKSQLDTSKNLFLTPQKLIEKHQNAISDYVEFMHDKSYIIKQGVTYYPTWKGAFKLIAQIISNPDENHDKKKIKPEEYKHEKATLITAEVNAYQHHHTLHHNPKFNNWIKTLIFLASGVFFAVLFGSAFSYTMLLALIPVLLFHEFGHFVMMKIFKYQDLQILFLPLGAAVTGKENNTSVLKKILVYLAGPAPGLILAYVLYAHMDVFVDSIWAEFMFELALMAFIINFFNLLPIKPLDGGQIFDLVLFSRMPVMQLIFQIISVLAFVLLAFWLSGTLIYVLALFLAFTLIGEIKNTKIKSKLKDQNFESEADLLAKIFWQLRTEPLNFEQKKAIVEQVKPQLEQPKARWHEITLGLIMYLSLLLSPFYVLYQSLDWFEVDEQYTSAYWQEQVEQQNSVADKLATYENAFSVLANEDIIFLTESNLVDEAMAFIKANQLQDHRLYAQLLKYDFLLSQFDDPDDIVQQKLSEITQELGPNHVVLGELYLALNSYQFNDNSSNQLDQVIQIAESNEDPDLLSQGLSQMASLQAHQQDFKAAIETTSRLMTIDPKLVHHHQLNLGWLYLLAGDSKLAAQNFIDITEALTEPDFYLANAYEGLGWVGITEKDYSQAHANFSRCDEINVAEIEAMGITYTEEIMSPLKYDKWVVLHWSNQDQEALQRDYASWIKLRTTYYSYEEAIEQMKVNHEMNSPHQIYTHPFIIQALESVQ